MHCEWSVVQKLGGWPNLWRASVARELIAAVASQALVITSGLLTRPGMQACPRQASITDSGSTGSGMRPVIAMEQAVTGLLCVHGERAHRTASPARSSGAAAQPKSETSRRRRCAR